MHSSRRRRPSRKMIQSASSSCFRYFTHLRLLTGLTEPPGGWLIFTAALELSRNQITHFYSLKKNTEEMIKMADRLRAEHRTCRTIYLSWDAASWHISRKLFSHLDEVNQQAVQDDFPVVRTAPLPAGAQFLNVI